MKSMQRLPARLISVILIFAILVPLILGGCVSINPYLQKSGDPSDRNQGEYTTYFFINNTDSDMGNNAYFSQNAGIFKPYLEILGYEKASYHDADLLLLLRYGIESRNIPEIVREPRYNELKNSTEWLHKENSVKESVFFTLRAVDAEDYRIYGLESEIWMIDYALPADEVPVAFPPVSAERELDSALFAEIVSRAMRDSVPAAFQAAQERGDGK
jgi:hypothetical protein